MTAHGPSLPAPEPRTGWHARLEIAYSRRGDTTVAHDRHQGPLRVLKPLYPEGPAVCQHVVLHPPGGIVGGDRLEVDLSLGAGCHALLTTPGASRFYRASGLPATQTVQARLGPEARLEWLPQETMAYPGCEADNGLEFQLHATSQMIGCDLLALGLPESGAAFDHGRLHQRIRIEGLWRDEGVLDGRDARWLASALGMAGRTVLGTLWWAAGSPVGDELRERLLAAAREDAAAPDDGRTMLGATSMHGRLVVVRVLADRVEPAAEALRRIWARWRPIAWNLEARRPRIWRT